MFKPWSWIIVIILTVVLTRNAPVTKPTWKRAFLFLGLMGKMSHNQVGRQRQTQFVPRLWLLHPPNECIPTRPQELLDECASDDMCTCQSTVIFNVTKEMSDHRVAMRQKWIVKYGSRHSKTFYQGFLPSGFTQHKGTFPPLVPPVVAKNNTKSVIDSLDW